MALEQGSGDSDVLVFVYGTLKRGQANHEQLESARWQGLGQLHGLSLHDLGPFPMAVPGDAPDACLQGEVYGVTPALLERLDRFEGAPRLYERQRRPLQDGRWVWVYVGRARQVRHVPVIANGCWSGPRQPARGDASCDQQPPPPSQASRTD